MTWDPSDRLERLDGSRTAFRAALALTAGALALPLWTAPRLPLQDYPQHLFMAQLYAGSAAEALDWSAYAVTGPATPYGMTYWLLAAGCRILPPDVAGRLLLTGVLALYAAVALRWGGDAEGAPRWPALLVLPLACHPLFFLGFLNFLLAVPLALLALTGLWRLRDGRAGGPALPIAAASLVALAFTHPFGLAAFTLLGAASLLRGARARSSGWWTALAAVAVAGALTLGWAGPAASAGGAPTGLTWKPARFGLEFLALTLNGMRGTEALDVAAPLWAVAAALLVVDARRGARVAPVDAAPAAAALLALFALPFAVGAVAYVNVRMVPFALALAVGAVARRPAPAERSWVGPALAAVCLALAVRGAALQQAVGREAGQIDGALVGLRPNAAVLPLVFDGASPALGHGLFHQLHAHEPFYYHTDIGGGVVAGLFYTQLLPVRYRDGAGPPAPFALRPGDFSWERHGERYDYVLVRGGPPAIDALLRQRMAPLATSGPWVAYGRRAVAEAPR